MYWEVFGREKAVRRVGVAYRELIGSLYESWTIGIERVYKKLIHNIIQQRQKCQKPGFEAKERKKIRVTQTGVNHRVGGISRFFSS